MGDRVGAKHGTVEDGCIVVERALGALLGEQVGVNEGDEVDGANVGIADGIDVGAKVGLVVGGVDDGVIVLGSIVGNALGVKLGIRYCKVKKLT